MRVAETIISEAADPSSSCGHQRPDVEDVQPLDMPQSSEVKKITLLDPATATTAQDSKGKFTMIYDEGFEVQVEGLTFFAFSRFDFVNGLLKRWTQDVVVFCIEQL